MTGLFAFSDLLFVSVLSVLLIACFCYFVFAFSACLASDLPLTDWLGENKLVGILMRFIERWRREQRR